MDIYQRTARLEARIRRRLATVDVAVRLPRTGRRYWMMTPADFDFLLAQTEADPEEYIPWWAEISPSGVALADIILERFETFLGLPALELGCGLGVTTVSAVEAGSKLLATDYSPDSLLLCRANALVNARFKPETLQLNWRVPSLALQAQADRIHGFPILLGADILYEERDVEPLIGLISQVLSPNAQIWLAEPGREPARQFLSGLEAIGWQDSISTHEGPWPDGTNLAVRIHMLCKPF